MITAKSAPVGLTESNVCPGNVLCNQYSTAKKHNEPGTPGIHRLGRCRNQFAIVPNHSTEHKLLQNFTMADLPWPFHTLHQA